MSEGGTYDRCPEPPPLRPRQDVLCSKYKLAVSFVSTKHADDAVLGYPVRGEILQGVSSPDEVNSRSRRTYS
jgi:hypothetical protein